MKSVALRVVVPAADADTASDKHDTAARNSARIRFFFTLNTSSKDVGEGKSLPHIVLCDNYCTASHAMMNRTDAMAVFVTASETGVTMASYAIPTLFAEVSPTPDI